MKKILMVIIILLSISCKRVEKNGYSFELSNYSTIKEVINNKDDVLKSMGNPSFISNINNDIYGELWVYYAEDLEKIMFLKPKIINRKIITISFEKNNRIKNIKNYNLENDNPIIFNKDYTKVLNTNKGLLSRIFSNIGQVKAN